MQRNDEKDTPSKQAGREFRWFFFIGVLTAIVSSILEGQGPPRPDASQAAARAIIARADSAAGRIGGRSKHKYTHMISETQASSVKTVTEVWTMEPNRVLTRVTMEGAGTMELGYNGTVGWTNSPFTGPVLLEGEQLKQLVGQVQDRDRLLASLTDLSGGAPTVVEGREVASVGFRHPSGAAGTLYFDAKTGLLHAMRSNDGTGPDSTTSVFTDYKRIDGELFAMTTTVRAGVHTIVTRTTHVDHQAIDTALFSPPAAVRELLKRP